MSPGGVGELFRRTFEHEILPSVKLDGGVRFAKLRVDTCGFW